MDSTKEHDAGSAVFAFICYSHTDQDVMEADTGWLQSQGITIWNDQNIRGGAEWNDELAFHIQHCSWFLFFVSPDSVESIHCRNELNYAQQHNRRIMVVEIAPTEIPPGLQLTLNNRQFLFRHQLSHDEYQRRLVEAFDPAVESLQQSTVERDRPAASEESQSRKWKRTAFLSAAFVLLAMVVAVKLIFPGPGSFAFDESDWVVVGEFENRTQDPLLNDSLELSMRLALEQSRFANVVPHSLIRAANARMQRDPDAPLNRNFGIEVAQREGAKALIIGNITEVGRAYTLSVELVNAIDGSTVWVASTRASDLEGVLPAVDEISRQLRARLGESLAAIEESTLPLAKVTTADLEALRAYSLSQKSVARGDWEGGIDLLRRALAIDPEFAMAHGKLAVVYFSSELFRERAADHWQTALDNSDRLSQREQLYIEASSAWLKTPMEMRSGWKMMSSMYPGQAVGFHNLGEVYRTHFGEFELAAQAFVIATQLPNPWRFASFNYLAQCQLALGQTEKAMHNFRTALEMENNPLDFGMADGYVVLRQYDMALQLLDTAAQMSSPRMKREAQFRRLGLYADRSELDAALVLSRAMLNDAVNSQLSNIESRVRAAEVALLERGDNHDEFRGALASALEFEQERLSNETGPISETTLTHLAILARVAVRSGASDLAEPVISLLRKRIPGNDFPVDQAFLELLEAEVSLQGGEASIALEHVQRSRDHLELFQTYETLSRVYLGLNDEEGQSVALNWMSQNRGRAFAERIDQFYGQLFNILDWSRSELALAQIHLQDTARIDLKAQGQSLVLRGIYGLVGKERTSPSAEGMPKPPTATAPSVIPSSPSSRSMSASLQAAVKKAPSPSSAHIR